MAGFGFPRSIFLSKDEKTACSSSGRTHTTTGQTALRDADQSPRVDILLSGGDRLLLSPLLTCSSSRHDVDILFTCFPRNSVHRTASLTGLLSVGFFHYSRHPTLQLFVLITGCNFYNDLTAGK